MSGASESEATPEESVTPAQPLLRVVKGDPTPEELAALVAVVAARNAAALAASRAPRRSRSEWGHPARLVRRPLRIGADQWRRSAWG